jgi:hypothetical protein
VFIGCGLVARFVLARERFERFDFIGRVPR